MFVTEIEGRKVFVNGGTKASFNFSLLKELDKEFVDNITYVLNGYEYVSASDYYSSKYNDRVVIELFPGEADFISSREELDETPRTKAMLGKLKNMVFSNLDAIKEAYLDKLNSANLDEWMLDNKTNYANILYLGERLHSQVTYADKPVVKAIVNEYNKFNFYYSMTAVQYDSFNNREQTLDFHCVGDKFGYLVNNPLLTKELCDGVKGGRLNKRYGQELETLFISIPDATKENILNAIPKEFKNEVHFLADEEYPKAIREGFIKEFELKKKARKDKQDNPVAKIVKFSFVEKEYNKASYTHKQYELIGDFPATSIEFKNRELVTDGIGSTVVLLGSTDYGSWELVRLYEDIAERIRTIYNETNGDCTVIGFEGHTAGEIKRIATLLEKSGRTVYIENGEGYKQYDSFKQLDEVEYTSMTIECKVKNVKEVAFKKLCDEVIAKARYFTLNEMEWWGEYLGVDTDNIGMYDKLPEVLTKNEEVLNKFNVLLKEYKEAEANYEKIGIPFWDYRNPLTPKQYHEYVVYLSNKYGSKAV